MDDIKKSPSYFWNCVTLNKDCPFISHSDPKLFYFGVGLLILYGAFLLMILSDLRFFWSLDSFQKRIDYYINLVRKKIRLVQMDQRRLVSTQERTEKLLKKTEDSKRFVTVLRGAVKDDPNGLATLASHADENASSMAEDRDNWNDIIY